MKKIITTALVLSSVMGFAQDYNGRVGINTNEPKASLEIRKHTGLPAERAQGVLFPKFSTAERSKFTNTEVGTMIFNTDKKCIEMYLGIVSGIHQWSCLPNANSSQQQNVSITPVGFEGSYIAGTNLTTENKVKFKVINNTFSTIGPIDFSSSVSITNGTANIIATGVSNNRVTMESGAEKVLEYTLSGTAQNGNLTADFSRLGLTATQSTIVGMGRATFSQSDNNSYAVSLVYNTLRIQGKINNGANKLTVKIPYINGKGSYNAYTNTQPTAAGEGGDVNNLTLSIPQGNFEASGDLTATITVDGDGEYLVKQMAPGQEYVIATFPITINGATTNVVLKGIGGVPDRNFGDGKHDFIYIPIEVTGADGYKKTWLNNNLGAEYSRLPSLSRPNPYFNPVKQAETINDWKAFGSLFQWQRKADGHEIVIRTAQNPKGVFTESIYDNELPWKRSDETFVEFDDYNGQGYTNIMDSSNLWGYNGSNDPCPQGYHVPTVLEYMKLVQYAPQAIGIVNWDSNNINLRLTEATVRCGYESCYDENYPYIWTSSFYDKRRYSHYAYIYNLKNEAGDSSRIHNGMQIRCIGN